MFIIHNKFMTATLLVILAGLVGCGDKEQPKPKIVATPPAVAPAPPPAAAPAPTAPAPAPQVAAAPAPVPAPAAPAQGVLATAGGQVLARSDGEKAGLSVEVTELKRGSGGTVTLKFVMVNNTKEKISFGYDYGAKEHQITDYGTVGGTHLIDAANKKKYLVVRDSERNCVCSAVKGNIPVGERMNLWAKFPAPPEDVKVISVMIPRFVPMDDVPISP